MRLDDSGDRNGTESPIKELRRARRAVSGAILVGGATPLAASVGVFVIRGDLWPWALGIGCLLSLAVVAAVILYARRHLEDAAAAVFWLQRHGFVDIDGGLGSLGDEADPAWNSFSERIRYCWVDLSRARTDLPVLAEYSGSSDTPPAAQALVAYLASRVALADRGPWLTPLAEAGRVIGVAAERQEARRILRRSRISTRNVFLGGLAVVAATVVLGAGLGLLDRDSPYRDDRFDLRQMDSENGGPAVVSDWFANAIELARLLREDLDTAPLMPTTAADPSLSPGIGEFFWYPQYQPVTIGRLPGAPTLHFVSVRFGPTRDSPIYVVAHLENDATLQVKLEQSSRDRLATLLMSR